MTQAIIDRFESFKRNLEAARDAGNPRDNAYLKGLREGIQVCIDCVDSEMDTIRAGMEAARKFETDQTG